MNALHLIERQLRHWDRMAAVLKKSRGPVSLAEVSKRPVLTVSGLTGSGHFQLAQALCKELDYQLYDRELLNAVANDLHCQSALLESLDERVKSNLELMFESLIRGREIEQQDYIHALVRVMGSLAEKGGAVILGRAGAMILGEKAALRILATAPRPVRIRRVMKCRKISESEAHSLVETRDREKSEFCRRYFRREICDALCFDLTINTERIEPENGVRIVQAALAARGIEIRKPAVPSGS